MWLGTVVGMEDLSAIVSRIRRHPRLVAGELEGADEVAQPLDLYLPEVLGQPVADFVGRRRVDEQGGADGDGAGAGQEELDGILPRLHAAHADDRHAGTLGD